MKVVALVSGGKDSCYAMMKCIEYGHEIVALANLLPVDDSVDELDSYMYQTVGHQVVVSYSKCMGLPLYRRRLQGSSRHQSLGYKMTQGDEVEDMFLLLWEVKRQMPSISAVSSGAIASDYQRLRVESVCSRLGLVSLAYLWKQDQSLLLEEMIRHGIMAVIVKVAAIGLDPSKHLGKEISQLQSHLHYLNGLYGINVCGEGGEYESLTLDCALFKFARIVLDDFEVVLHSSDSIAPVGVLRPLAFHLEAKNLIASSDDIGNNDWLEEMNSVHEVLGDCLHFDPELHHSFDLVFDMKGNKGQKFHTSKIKMDGTFSMCCWLQDFCSNSTGLDNDLKCVLRRIESELKEQGFGWENVLYVHLYISNMDEFAKANETYTSFITQEKCSLGVPSRSTLELPLLEASLGRVYIEVLASNKLTKRVLHVQSISCWAPSCIGPYSQATLHSGMLYMAGQLGLDPPTMTLCKGGAAIELQQALVNSEAVAKCFNCSISTNTVIFVVYCSMSIPSSERSQVQDQQEMFIKQLKVLQADDGSFSRSLDPVILYILVPDLPKRALVEVKPILYSMEDMHIQMEITTHPSHSCTIIHQSYWGFQHDSWHSDCMQKYVIPGKICYTLLCITDEVVAKICQSCVDSVGQNWNSSLTGALMDKVSKFCIYLMDGVLVENSFTWKDAVYLRIYYPTTLPVPMHKLSVIFNDAFHEFAKMNLDFESRDEPFFNIVPVIGCGTSAKSMDALITCELLAQKCEETDARAQEIWK
ncbi:hypothetical protein Dimus_021836 [Dionaea muscipula]